MALYPWAGPGLFPLCLMLAAALPPRAPREVMVAFGASAEHPISHRPRRSVPEDFSAPLEVSQPLSGLVDDYGIRPKHPWPRGPRRPLSRAQRRERDRADTAKCY